MKKMVNNKIKKVSWILLGVELEDNEDFFFTTIVLLLM